MKNIAPPIPPIKSSTLNRQKSVSVPEPSLPGPPPKKGKTKRSWPILEVALIVLLAKIGLGAYYLLTGGTGAQIPQDTASMMDAAAQLATPAITQKPSNEGKTPTPKPATSRLDEYLAVISPAVAQAASGPSAISAISAGAMMVLASQSATPEVAAQSTLSSIPLPPGAGDLRRPASTPQAATNNRTARDPSPGQAEINNSSLRTREQELARREELLTTREQALSGLEAELNQRLAAIESSRSALQALTQRNQAIVAEQKALLEEQQTEEQNLRDARLQHLVTAYGGMKPEQAGRLVNNLDEDVAVAILAAMPGRKAGQILGMVDSEKAARLTKAISDQRIDPKLLLAEQSPSGPM